MQPSFNALAIAIHAAESIDAANSLEKMLAHQLAVAHEASLRLMDRALAYEAGGRSMREGDSVEACRLVNAAARMMTTFQDGLIALQRLRTVGNQTVTVQHVNVAPGAQAIVGNVGTSERKGRGRNPNDRQAHAESAGGAGKAPALWGACQAGRAALPWLRYGERPLSNARRKGHRSADDSRRARSG